MAKLAVGAIPAIVLALSAVSLAAAQAPDVIISQLNCTGDPELVIVKNQGSASQDFTGWELRSDPEASEVFSLSVLGTTVGPGVSNTIQSGPSAAGRIWATDEIFRENDPTDYVKLVDNTGATVEQVNCAGAAAEPTPTATPAPSPVGEMPNGGGPPPPPIDLLSPGMIILIGGSLAAAGFGAIALPWLRLLPSPVAVSSPSRRPAARRGRGHGDWKPGYSTVSLVAVAFTAVILFRFLRGSSD